MYELKPGGCSRKETSDNQCIELMDKQSPLSRRRIIMKDFKKNAYELSECDSLWVVLVV